MIAYFDSSALVKLVIEEPGSDSSADLWDAADAVLSSRVAYPEVRAALAAAQRNHRLTDPQLAGATDLWAELWEALRVVELTDELAQRSGELAEEHALSGFDAVHLASALLFPAGELVVATWDGRLHAALVAVGLTTLPAEWPPSSPGLSTA